MQFKLSKSFIILNSLHVRKYRGNLHAAMTQLQYHDDALCFKQKKIAN